MQLEHCGGEFPLWLAPVQVRLLRVKDDVIDYCMNVKAQALKMGLRVEVDTKADRLPKQIRNAEQDRVPLMCVVGDKERSNGQVAVRTRGTGDIGSMDVAEFLRKVKEAVDSRTEFS